MSRLRRIIAISSIAAAATSLSATAATAMPEEPGKSPWYDADETWGANAQGWVVDVNNKTSGNLVVTSKSNIEAGVSVIASDSSVLVNGNRGWSFGYFPLDIKVRFTATDDPQGTFRYVSISGAIAYDAIVSCGIERVQGQQILSVAGEGCDFTAFDPKQIIGLTFDALD